MAQSGSASVPQSVAYRLNRRFPTLDHVWIFAAMALIALRPLLTPIPPHDFWWHMATGRLIVETGHIPQVDQFSYTQAGEPFYNQSWLAQVLMYTLYSLGGVHLVLVVQAFLLALTYGMVLHLCVRRSGALRLSVGLLLLTTMPLSFDNWNVRPQTYAFPLFVGFLIILTQWRFAAGDTILQARPRLFSRQALFSGHMLWLLPLLMMIWVNLHGSFVLGGALIALVFVGEWWRRFIDDRRRANRQVRRSEPPGDGGSTYTGPAHLPLLPLFFWGGVTALAMFINPRGIAVLSYVRELLGNSAVTELVTEWAPPTTRSLAGSIFFLFLMFCIVVLTYGRRRPDPIDMLLAGAFLWLALGAVRNIVWFGIIITPLLTVQAASWLLPGDGTAVPVRRRFAGSPRLNALLIGFLAFLVLLGLPWIKPVLDLPPELGTLVAPDTPVAATDHMQAEPQRPAHLFHSLGYGSYLIWAAPDQPVFIDPRIELYPYDQWRDYIRLSAGHDVEALLAKYQIDGLLLDNTIQAGLLEHVQATGDWEVRYTDEQSSYLVKRTDG